MHCRIFSNILTTYMLVISCHPLLVVKTKCWQTQTNISLGKIMPSEEPVQCFPQDPCMFSPLVLQILLKYHSVGETTPSHPISTVIHPAPILDPQPGFSISFTFLIFLLSTYHHLIYYTSLVGLVSVSSSH